MTSLHAEQSVERHEEEEEYGDVVDLLARPLEDLVDPRLRHRELEEDADAPDHDHRARGAQDRQWGVRRGHLGQLQTLR